MNAERLILDPCSALNPAPFFRVAVRYGNQAAFVSCQTAGEILTVSDIATIKATNGSFKRWHDLEIHAEIEDATQ